MSKTQDPIINLALPLSVVNVLLQGTATLPYHTAAPVMHEVQRQAEAQLTAGVPPSAEAAPQPAA